MEWTIGWRPRWLGEVETVELASITRPALAAAADAVGLSFEETRPLLDGAHPFYACRRFGIRGDHRPGRSQGTLSPAVCVGWRRDRATRGLGPHPPGRSRLAGKVGLRRSLAMVIRHCGLWRCGGQPATDILDRSHLKAGGRH